VQRVERACFAAPRNPFNILIADAREAFLVVGGQDVTVRPLSPGSHVLTNQHQLGELDLGDLTPPADIDAALDRLGAISRDHGTHGYSICKHGDRYGTVSSALIAAGEDREHPDRFAFADGMPCQKQHLELKEQVRSLR
jgi:hypothetical protein